MQKQANMIHGLYVITDAELMPLERFAHLAEQAILGGANVVQYRDKSTDTLKRLAQAHYLQQLCEQHAIPLMINDDIALCRQVGAAGVHVGKEDTSVIEAREQLGKDAIIGASCYDDLDRAQRMRAMGADYLAFGRFFPSTTKPQASAAKLDILSQAKATLDCPIVAIGGITTDNGSILRQAGADALAVVGGVFATQDVYAAAQQLSALLKPSTDD